MKTGIILTTTESATGKKRKRSFSDINPNATNTELKNFAQAFNALTTNQYVETSRVDTTNVDDEDTRKKLRNIQITGATQGATATISANINSGGTVSPAVFFYSNGSAQILTTTSAESDKPTVAKCTVTIPNNNGQIFIGITATNSFYADFASATIE